MKRSLLQGYTTSLASPTLKCEDYDNKAINSRQTRMTLRPRSMLSARSSGTTAQTLGRDTKRSGTNTRQRKIHMCPPPGCLLSFSNAAASPHGYKVYRDPGKKESVQCSHKCRRTIFHSRLLRLTGRGTPYTSVSSSLCIFAVI